MSRILVVDDEAAVVELVERFLKRAGHQVMRAANGREALQRIEEQVPDVVLTDVYMPEKDGIELILELSRLPERPRLVAMSGGGLLNDTTMLGAAEKLGAVRILPKPFKREELLAAVDAALAD